jgi:CHAT domain-containing protein
MWSIPENETKELMVSFYGKWLSGEDKHQAFREAELDERKKVILRWGRDRPDLWAGFVLIGP